MIWDSPLADKPAARARADHPVWQEIRPKDGFGGFEPWEFDQPHEMDVEFLRLLYRIRQDAGVPMRIISDARPPDQDIGASKSAHKKRPCRAVDLDVRNSYERARIVGAAWEHGIRRLGVYPGDAGDAGSVHLDAEAHPDNKSPRMWTRY